MGNNWGTAGGAGGDSSVNQVSLVAHSQNPPRVDGKMLLKEEAHNFLRAYDTYCRRTEDDRTAGVQCTLIQDERAAAIQSERRNITLLLWRPRVD